VSRHYHASSKSIYNERIMLPDYQAPGFEERASYQLMLFERLGAARGLGHRIAAE
jgi:hypothetical protein